MKHLAQKLKSRRGASMLFALLVFFLCLLTGVAALTAAAANAGRYTHLQGEQQQYFSVASALELLQGELAPADGTAPVSVQVECVETVEWYYENTGTASDPKYELHETTQPKTYNVLFPAGVLVLTPLQTLLLQNCLPKEWVDGLSLTGTPARFTEKYSLALTPDSLTPTPPDWADTLYRVYVTVTNDDVVAADGSPYALQMSLSTRKDAGGAYALTAVWSGVADVQTETETTTTGDPAATPSRGTRTTTTTLTCTLRWSADNRVVTFEDRP